mmetsp:Transcript_45596/g.67216  ORF Transcript_45596/g.67216 Transcript_45596/m.67216 type:complete len:465 (-) Transcript_45596:104-1498(-)|eukprot:CAMPEP_0195523498 /NCGR_PEP_ID=MMETSP0794_2-20130614/22732_1 /TAXON_ID=515487 /ORGANISM="Stephanopyxis turris, Strain CCMP 815" /LENGTH=464 /DNA_ID=CAMNT_0040653513 /DNA_START=171 /DNA_END=1565 /DNA_ORIENTATION=+
MITRVFCASSMIPVLLLTIVPSIAAFTPSLSSSFFNRHNTRSSQNNNHAKTTPSSPLIKKTQKEQQHVVTLASSSEATSGEDNNSQQQQPAIAKAPTFNGKMVFPLKALKAGLTGHKVAAVYAVLSNEYKRGKSDGWEHCQYIGSTLDLDIAIKAHVAAGHDPKTTLANIRAISFTFPQPGAMDAVKNKWVALVKEHGGNVNALTDEAQGEEEEDDDEFYDDDDDIDLYDLEEAGIMPPSNNNMPNNNMLDFAAQSMELMKSADSSKSTPTGQINEEIVSPFAKKPSEEELLQAAAAELVPAEVHYNDGEEMEFTSENVDKALEEIRPYLISDGGNVRVEKVDEQKGNVYLVLEGACGSCPSSTVTMKMGIERVLKENFPKLNEVIQVEPEVEESTELTLEAVQAEVNRLKPAILAMGGVMEIVSVDPLGVVEMKFRGSNKVQTGLELAIQDVPLVKHVKFVSD